MTGIGRIEWRLSTGKISHFYFLPQRFATTLTPIDASPWKDTVTDARSPRRTCFSARRPGAEPRVLVLDPTLLVDGDPGRMREAYTLTAGRDCPAVSLYVTFDDNVVLSRFVDSHGLRRSCVSIAQRTAPTGGGVHTGQPRNPRRSGAARGR